MKVLILTCYESNEERVSFVYDACEKRKYNVKVLTTDFSHIKKAKRSNIPAIYQAIETKPYNSNLSIARMISHFDFARDVFKVVESEKPDLIWMMAPANTLIKEAKLYKTNNPETKIVVDMIDMWPESLPIKIKKTIFPFNIWRNIRRNNIDCADVLVTECDFYKEILKDEYHKNIYTIRWSKRDEPIVCDKNISSDKLSLCYIGSINNIIDTNEICRIIKNINLPVRLHIIGEGENKDKFIELLSKVCEVIYHGAVRDEKQKAEIFAKCHAGLNIYKDNLYIGLTVKCIDYFGHGLPIINNIKGDTWYMVDNNKIGINVNKDTNIDVDRILEMRNEDRNIFDFYNANFTKEIFTRGCLKVIDEVIK